MAHDDVDRITKIVNRSGFPLQMGVASLIARTEQDHHCNVLYTEHSWKSADDDDGGFIDLVVELPHARYVFVVECKRVLESSWIFLRPTGGASLRRQAKLWVTEYATGRRAFNGFGWQDCALEPETPESNFCVIDGQDDKARPMLERVAGDLVAATEAFAKEDAKRLAPGRHTAYASVIVTTAKLKVATFDAATVSMVDGKVNALNCEDVPFLRFRKQLSTAHADLDNGFVGFSGLPPNIGRAKERSVFIVNSESLINFLAAFEVDGWATR